MIIHPKELSPGLQYAVDQYVLKGKNLMVFADPFSVSDDPRMPSKASTGMEALFKAWGIEMDLAKAVTDFDLVTRLRGQDNQVESNPLWLSIPSEFLNRENIITAQLESLLLRVSEMVCELPWLKEMDINPLIVDETGALAADARVMVDFYPLTSDRYTHMAIYPYPSHLVENWQLPDGTDIVIRPIRPEDAEIEQEFVRNLSDEAKYFRFMNTVHELSQAMLVRFTQIDYDREMALIAVTMENGKEVEIGVCRYAINPDGESCEFALVVADAWQHKAIAHKLMANLMDAARHKGLKTIEGEVLAKNSNMLKLMERLGFDIRTSEEDPAIKRVNRAL